MPIPAAKLQELIANAERNLPRQIAAQHTMLALPVKDSVVARQIEVAEESIAFTRTQISQWKIQLEGAREEAKENPPQ